MATFTRSVADGATLRRFVACNDRTMRDPRVLRAAILMGEASSITDTALAGLLSTGEGTETTAGALELLRAIAAAGAGSVA